MRRSIDVLAGYWLVVQLLSCARLITPWTAAHQASLLISWSLLKFKSLESVILYKHLILYCPLFLLPSIFPSIRVFSKESALLVRWPKYWSFSFGISPADEHLGPVLFKSGLRWSSWWASVVLGVIKLWPAPWNEECFIKLLTSSVWGF